MKEFLYICSAAEDAAFARRLADYLRRRGVRVLLSGSASGEPAAAERDVAEAIGHCHVFALLLSPAALNSWAARDQTLLAEQSSKEIILLQRRPCPVPALLAPRPVIDLSRAGWRRRAALRKLLTLLHVPPRQQPGHFSRDWLLEFGWPPPLLLFLMVVFIAAALFLPRFLASGPAAAFPAEAPAAPSTRPAMVIQPEKHGAPNARPTPVETHIRPGDGKKMVFVPAGDFLMGAPAGDANTPADEQPQILVFVDDFWIDQTEVTNAQYRLCVQAGGCTPSIEKRQAFVQPQHPVVGVNWEQAQSYCHWAGGRLPTEAEWEKAARGVDGRIYPWGDDFDSSRLNYCDSNCVADWRDFSGDDGYRYTAPAFAYPQGASPYGALNMSGNVWEWVADWYAPDAYLRAAYRNPAGPPQGQQRVIRGGSWLYNGRNVRVTRRQKELPTYQYENIGFRCGLTTVQP